jgi:hypothetical protein
MTNVLAPGAKRNRPFRGRPFSDSRHSGTEKGSPAANQQSQATIVAQFWIKATLPR